MHEAAAKKYRIEQVLALYRHDGANRRALGKEKTRLEAMDRAAIDALLSSLGRRAARPDSPGEKRGR